MPLSLCNYFSHWCENRTNSSRTGPVHECDFLLPKPLIHREEHRLIHGPTACYRYITVPSSGSWSSLPSPTIRTATTWFIMGRPQKIGFTNEVCHEKELWSPPLVLPWKPILKTLNTLESLKTQILKRRCHTKRRMGAATRAHSSFG